MYGRMKSWVRMTVNASGRKSILTFIDVLESVLLLYVSYHDVRTIRGDGLVYRRVWSSTLAELQTTTDRALEEDRDSPTSEGLLIP